MQKLYLFFYQPFKYKLSIVKKKIKDIKYINCIHSKTKPTFSIFNSNILREYWHDISYKFIPIKNNIIKEANNRFLILFNNSINILGVLIRGTDYIAKKPSGHAVQPTPAMVFKDIKKFDNKNKYDYIFITTEDDIIRNKFILEFKIKLKYFKSKTKINYNYKKKQLLAFNENIKGNNEYMKTYLINIIILSKCIDIITSRTAGSIVAFILSKGFANIKVYNLGFYK